MKGTIALALCAGLSACAPSPDAIGTAIAQTEAALLTAVPTKAAPTVRPTATATHVPLATPTSEWPAAAFGDGVWTVSGDIQPGTYVTQVGAGLSDSCYWARLSGFDGTIDNIIANGLETGVQAVVTITPNDKGFSSEGCGTWYELQSWETRFAGTVGWLLDFTEDGTGFGAGTWIVGFDLPAGTYVTDGANNCYWARLSSFDGDVRHIIANGLPGNHAIVTVRETDVGFAISGDCMWLTE